MVRKGGEGDVEEVNGKIRGNYCVVIVDDEIR